MVTLYAFFMSKLQIDSGKEPWLIFLKGFIDAISISGRLLRGEKKSNISRGLSSGVSFLFGNDAHFSMAFFLPYPLSISPWLHCSVLHIPLREFAKRLCMSEDASVCLINISRQWRVLLLILILSELLNAGA